MQKIGNYTYRIDSVLKDFHLCEREIRLKGRFNRLQMSSL